MDHSYFEYLNRYQDTLGPYGSALKEEIEIIQDPKKMKEIESSTGRQVGIIAEDDYWIWFNDAVKFPNGEYGVYGRIVWKCSLNGRGGVAIMPVLPNGKILLNRNFRHATRSWEYELPRGCLEKGETIEQAGIRELKEETGIIADNLHYLGEVLLDSGMTNTIVPVFLTNVKEIGPKQKHLSEAIASIDAVSIDEIKQGFKQGSMQLDGSPKIFVRDPMLCFGLFQAEIKGLI